MDFASGDAGQRRAANFAKVIAAFLEVYQREGVKEFGIASYAKNLIGAEAARSVPGSSSVPNDPADQALEKVYHNIPPHCNRWNRRCLVCYAVNEVASSTTSEPHVRFHCSLISFLNGCPQMLDWGKDDDGPKDRWLEHLKSYFELPKPPPVDDLKNRLRLAGSSQGESLKPECQTCAMLQEGIADFVDPLKLGYHHDPLVHITANLEEGLLVTFWDLRLEYYLLRGAPPSPWNVIKSASHIPPDSQSDESYRNIRRWITGCTMKHPICPSNDSTPLPKRLIDVSAGQNPKLYESAGESGKYVALSHRWGTSLIKTTLTTYTRRRLEIKWGELPRIFQDAITITRRLGLSYVWIDSLCIVQDDIKDWQEQSAQMASIYAGSFITIAATSSGDSDSTCLSHTNRSEMPAPLNAHQIFARKQIKHEHMFNSRTNDVAYPLFSRAWCFQERLLATRILHYTEQEIVFECRTGYQCECDGIWKGNDEAVSGCMKLAYAQILQESRQSGKGDRYLGPTLSSSCNKETLLWFRVLGDYTTKKMTFERDTLPALSGVADRMPTDLMGDYLAGLWQNDLVYGLLWRSEDAMECSRHRIYIAPSFSWASRSGPITFPPFTSRYQLSASVLEAKCETATFNRTGEVRDGFVKLRGVLAQLSYSRDAREGNSPISYLRKEGLDQKVVVMVDARNETAELVPRPVFCLSMLQYGRPPKHVALVLKECNFPGRSDGFLRIGLANEVPGFWFRNTADREVTIY